MARISDSSAIPQIVWRPAAVFLLLHALIAAWAFFVVLVAISPAEAEAIDGSVSFASYLALYVGAPLVVILSLAASMILYETKRYRCTLAISALVVVGSASVFVFLCLHAPRH